MEVQVQVEVFFGALLQSSEFVCLFVICLSFGSYSADVDLLYPPTHIHTEDSHNTANFIPYSSRIVFGFFNVPLGTNEHVEVICEMGPPAYRPYPRRLESLTICGCNYKGSTFSPVI